MIFLDILGRFAFLVVLDVLGGACCSFLDVLERFAFLYVLDDLGGCFSSCSRCSRGGLLF